MVSNLEKAVCPQTETTAAKLENTHRKIIKLMGCRFEITAIHEEAQLAWDAINAAILEMDRVESIISSWKADSQTSEINRQAGISPVKVDAILFNLIARSLKISKLTGGAFDISYGSMDKVWKFDGSMKKIPGHKAIKRSVAKIGFQHIILDQEHQTVFLKKTGMKIGFGGIGKGLAANIAKKVMIAKGVENGLVNASGDLIAWGKQEHGNDFKVGIASPSDISKIHCYVNLNNTAIVTSGDYESCVFFNGVRYGHIIDPRTGYPTTGIKSVSLICPDPELGDALATSVFVLGVKAGLNMINQIRGVECLIVTDDDKMLHSANLNIEQSNTSKRA